MLYNIIKLDKIPKITFAHIYSCPNYTARFPSYNAANIEIVYVESGELLLEIKNEKIYVKEKSFIILPHKFPFSLTTARDCSHIHYTVSSMIDSNSLISSQEQKNINNILCVPICLSFCEETYKLLSTLKTIIKEHQGTDSLSAFRAGALTLQLLCDISSASKKEEIKISDATFNLDLRIKKYIEKNLDKKITLSDISDFVGKNANYINQLFKKQNNLSIISYTNLEKMKKVASLIIDKNYSLKEAAREIGISNVNYLSRLFKKTMNMTISQYKESSADVTFPLVDLNKIY